jgi:hypothetical protein
MKIKSIKKIPKVEVFDISVKDEQHYVLENGVVTHNSGPLLSANNVYFIGRSQEKDGTELSGYNFNITVEKSRTVKEKSKLPLTVMFDSGINKFSGLLDLALELKAVIKPSNGWYSKVNLETGEVEEKKYRAADTQSDDFWAPILSSKEFKELVKCRYKLGYSSNKNNISEDGEEQ